MNKARVEHEIEQERSKKGNGKKKQTEFDMSSVKVTDINLLANSISSEYRDHARSPLSPFLSL